MITWQIILLRLGLASVLGAIIGLERERKDWSAGMRTHMMVCLGATLVIIVSAYGFNDVLKTDKIVLDPARIAAQVVSGIGFLGAGIIMFLKPGFIRGLTTASGLWTVAAIGLAVGSGLYFAAIVATGIAFIILLFLKPLEKNFTKYFKHNFVRIYIQLDADPARILNFLMTKLDEDIETFSFDKGNEGYIIELKFRNFNIKKSAPVLAEIEKDEKVTKVHWDR